MCQSQPTAELYQRRKGGSWYVKFSHPVTGQVVRRSLNTSDKKVAGRKKILHEAELIKGHDELTLSGLRSRYFQWAAIHHRPKTTQFNVAALDRFVEFYGDKPIARIRLAHIEAWKVWLFQQKVRHTDRRLTITTVNNYRRGMVQLVNRPIEMKWYDGENPFLDSERIKEERPHSAIKYQTPRAFRLAWEQRNNVHSQTENLSTTLVSN